MPKILLVENSNSLKRISPSGSYWFRLEMAYGWHALGWTPFLVQHPQLQNFPWVNSLTWPTNDSHEVSDFDLILLLGDFPHVPELVVDCPVVFWDIEGLPSDPPFFENYLKNPQWGNHIACSSRKSSLREELKIFYYHLKKQELQHWSPDHIYSIAKKPLLRRAKYLPMGAESDLYNLKDILSRDIRLAIVGRTESWFGSQERIDKSNDVLQSWNYPRTYWFGAVPEINSGTSDFPRNCFPMGVVDFFSIRYILQRIRFLLHISRSYHQISRSISATLFQSLAAGAIPLHTNTFRTNLGYSVKTVQDLDKLEVPDFLPEYTYQNRFRKIVEDVF